MFDIGLIWAYQTHSGTHLIHMGPIRVPAGTSWATPLGPMLPSVESGPKLPSEKSGLVAAAVKAAAAMVAAPPAVAMAPAEGMTAHAQRRARVLLQLFYNILEIP